MKHRKKISLIFLLLVSGVCGYLLGEFDFRSEKEKNPKETTIQVVEKVVSNTRIVQTKKEIKSAVIERIKVIPHKLTKFKMQKPAFFYRDISAVEPKYLMSYYTSLLSAENIRGPTTRLVHHIAMVLQKNKYIAYISEFINNAHLYPVIWRQVLILNASDSSP